ncbi:MAG: prolyl oligopeptidase family serine peptidase [Candidatus Marinimicrobia bacterium]|nr:prolyl oligopeptidase family serine peptidase [Candidatus Neomarinimicrobiota bacterium]
MVTDNNSGTGFIYDVDHRAKNIEQIKCPVLIIHSKNDGSVPFSHAEYANKKIKQSELFVAPTDSHFIYIGQGSEEVLRKRFEFLK